MVRYCPTRDTTIPDKADIRAPPKEYGSILIASQLLTNVISKECLLYARQGGRSSENLIIERKIIDT